MNVKHHDGQVLVIVVELSALVPKLRLHFDDTVEGVGGDESLVAAVQLEQDGRVAAVQIGVVNASPRARLREVLKVAPVELECVGRCCRWLSR